MDKRISPCNNELDHVHTEAEMKILDSISHAHMHELGISHSHPHTYEHTHENGETHTHSHDHSCNIEHNHDHTHSRNHDHNSEHEHEHNDEHEHKHKHEHGHVHNDDYKKTITNRMARVIGHMQSVKTMMENDRDCSDILIQLSAIDAAVRSVSRVILKEHISTCMIDAVRDGDYESIDEMIKAMDKFMK